MKLLLLLCVVFVASGINAHVAKVADILKPTQKIYQYFTECINEEEYDIKNDDVTEIFSGERNKDKAYMEQVTRCFFHKAGILEPDGKLNSDAAMAILQLTGAEKNDAEELLQRCTGFDEKDIAYSIFKCFDDGVRR